MSVRLINGRIGLLFTIQGIGEGRKIRFLLQFYFDTHPLFNPAILSASQIPFEDDENNSFVSMLVSALHDGLKNTWVSSDHRSVEMTVLPLLIRGWNARKETYRIFPDAPKTSPKEKKFLMRLDADRKKGQGKLPGDMFEIGLFFHANRMNDLEDVRDTMEFPGVKILYTRTQVEEFLANIKKEIEEFYDPQ